MRWGEASAQPGSLEWVRPLHAIVATFGPETEEPEIVHVATGGITSGNTTHGHRFLADLALGQTVTPVLHRLNIPVLVVPNPERAAPALAPPARHLR